jgi:mono/diheme cytochrome c family protein
MKWLKRIGLSVLALLALIVGGAVVKLYLLSPLVRPPTDAHAPSTPEAIARGKYLAEGPAMCIACHSPSDSTQPGQPLVPGHDFEGRAFTEMVGFPGNVRAPNLTSDRETGLGNFTDGEILRAMREGIGRDGRPLFPMMPYERLRQSLSDDDALAIIAYLRTLPPVKHDAGKTELGVPLNFITRLAPRPLEKSPPPLPTDTVARGQQLMLIAGCEGCHSTHDARHQLVPGHFLAGGDEFPMPSGQKLHAPNITSDAATGVGAYTDEDLRRAITQGVGKNGRPLYFMPWPFYRNLNEEDLSAIIAALRTVPAVMHPVPVSSAAPVTAAAAAR